MSESNTYKSIDISLTIYDIEGRVVKNLVAGNTLPGSYSVSWDGTNKNGVSVSSGQYLVELTGDKMTRALKIILNK